MDHLGTGAETWVACFLVVVLAAICFALDHYFRGRFYFWEKEMERRRLKDLVFLKMALDISKLGTCPRRQTGCVLVDIRGNLFPPAFNGTGRGLPHCTDHPCGGEGFASGQGLGKCQAIHAEQNALIQCPRPYEIATAYCTDSPCFDSCIKLLCNTSCQRIVFLREYPHQESQELWLSKPGRTWEHIPLEELAVLDTMGAGSHD